MMTDTEATRRILGASCARHYNRALAETLQANIEQIGLPTWTEEDQAFARPCSAQPAASRVGLNDVTPPLATSPFSAGTDDIGDVSWVVPTVQLRYPANIPRPAGASLVQRDGDGHPDRAQGHRRRRQGGGVTALDLMLQPELIAETRRYFTEVQSKDRATSRSSVPTISRRSR